MTTQIPERLIYKGDKLVLVAFPLSQFFELSGDTPPFQAGSSACWRGYVGNWEIADGRLYLLSLSGSLKNGAKASLEIVFPGFSNRVFAHWFTGTLDIPQGRPLPGIANPYIVQYERTLKLKIRKGTLLSERVQENGTAPDDTLDTGYPISAMTVFGDRAGRRS